MLLHLRAIGLLLILSLSLVISHESKAKEAGYVVASIQPICSLIRDIVGKTVQVNCLVQQGSVHDVTLKPSDMRLLRGARMVAYIGDDFETFLPDAFKVLPASVRPLALENAEGVVRSKNAAGQKDGHIWLDINNLKKITDYLVEQLIDIYPNQQASYKHNGNNIRQRLTRLDQELKQMAAPIKGKTFIVTHDAFSAIQSRYGLNPAIIAMHHPEETISAHRVKTIRDIITHEKVACMVVDPNTPQDVVEALTQGLQIHTIQLDPLTIPGLTAQIRPLYEALPELVIQRLTVCINHL